MGVDNLKRNSRGSVLHVRQLVPPLTLHTPHGRTVQAWDFKQRKNLVIAFLDTRCALCEAFIGSLASSVEMMREQEAVALLTFPGESFSELSRALPPEIIAGCDVEGRGVRLFLGEEEVSAQKRHRRGVFLTDRYGELSALWIVAGHEFPRMEEIRSSLDLVEIACEECSVPDWPVEDK